MNPDLLLVILGLFGSGTLAMMAFAFGFNKNAVLSDKAQVIDLVKAYAPDAGAMDIVVSENAQSALAFDQSGQRFLVTMLGNKPVVRTVLADQIDFVADDYVRIDFGDLGFPKLDFHAPQTQLKAVLGSKKGLQPS
jgi:hypothetical protein